MLLFSLKKMHLCCSLKQKLENAAKETCIHISEFVYLSLFELGMLLATPKKIEWTSFRSAKQCSYSP